MGLATTADLEEQAGRGLERYRRVTYRSFVIAALGFLAPCVGALALTYGDGRAGALLAAAALPGLAALTWLYLRLVRAGLAGRTSPRDAALSSVIAAALSLLLALNPLWTTVPVFWVSGLAVTPMRTRTLAWCCLGGGVHAALVLTLLGGGDRPPWYQFFPASVALFTATCAFAAFINRYQRRTWDLHRELHAGRDALARLAVTEERMRFSRDLHDLLGHSLALIAVKSELAMRTAAADPSRASAEMADVQRAARDALREVRAAVHGYRAVELDAELAGVRAVLEAAGVRCDAPAPPDGLPPEIRTALAWIIREGATNVIKHSEARHCSVSLAAGGGTVLLEMRNDGVRAAPRAPGPAGSGLLGLTERVAALGGGITAAPHGRDGFLLRATVPLPAAAAPAPAEPGGAVTAGRDA